MRLIDLYEYEQQSNDGELVPTQVVALIEEARMLRKLIRRAIKYAREDGMVTPRATRMQRLIDEMARVTAGSNDDE